LKVKVLWLAFELGDKTTRTIYDIMLNDEGFGSSASVVRIAKSRDYAKHTTGMV
jgi:hypothetical protein